MYQELLNNNKEQMPTSCRSGSITAISASARAASISISTIPVLGFRSVPDRSSAARLIYSIESGNSPRLEQEIKKKNIHQEFRTRLKGKREGNLNKISSSKHGSTETEVGGGLKF